MQSVETQRRLVAEAAWYSAVSCDVAHLTVESRRLLELRPIYERADLLSVGIGDLSDPRSGRTGSSAYKDLNSARQGLLDLPLIEN